MAVASIAAAQRRFRSRASARNISRRGSRRGRSTLDNLAFACQGCNNHKFTKTHSLDPASGEVVPLFHPRTQRWRDHFAWSDDLTLIVGLTPTGRATVEALRLNRPGLVNLRRVLILAGEHPPEDVAHD